MKAKKLLVSFLGAVIVAAPVVAWAGSPAQAGGQLNEPPDCGSHVPCPGDPKPQPQSPVDDDECARHIRCPDGGDGGVDPTPDDGCPIGRPCNNDAPGYQPPGAPDVPPPDDKPGKRVELKNLDPKPKSKSSKPKAEIPPPPDCGSHVPCPGDPVPEAKAPKPKVAQPRTVG